MLIPTRLNISIDFGTLCAGWPVSGSYREGGNEQGSLVNFLESASFVGA
jgi:hypothetical protein